MAKEIKDLEPVFTSKEGSRVPVSGSVSAGRQPSAGLNPVVSTQGAVNVPVSDGAPKTTAPKAGSGGGGKTYDQSMMTTTPTPAPAPAAGSGGGGKTYDQSMMDTSTKPSTAPVPAAGSGGGGKTYDPNMMTTTPSTTPKSPTSSGGNGSPASGTPSTSSAPASSGAPSTPTSPAASGVQSPTTPGQSSPSGGTKTVSEQQATEIINNAIQSEPDEVTNYLLDEYRNLDSFYAEMKSLIDSNTANLIDLSNKAIDIQTQYQLSQLAASLDQAKAQYAQERARSLYSASQAADNLALMNAQAGNLGGIGQKQYSDQAAQYDQALRDIDLAQISVESQINQAIAEAQATGDYNKLQYQLQVTADAYDQLTSLAANMQEMKIRTAGALDSYYESTREYNDNYRLRVQKLQQDTILSKIESGISVTPEDMAVFGLSGADAQNAAENINSSQGVERQILQEQLKSLQQSYDLQGKQAQQNMVLQKIESGISVTPEDMAAFGLSGADAQNAAANLNSSQGVERQILQEQLKSIQRSNSGSSGGSRSSSSSEKSNSSGGGVDFSTEVPGRDVSAFVAAMNSDGGLTVKDASGNTKQVYFSADGATPTRTFQRGDSTMLNNVVYYYDGNMWVPADTYNAGSGASETNQSDAIMSDLYAQTKAASDAANNYLGDLYIKYTNQITRYSPDAPVSERVLLSMLTTEERSRLDQLSSKANNLIRQYESYGGKWNG